jgi:predicted nucleic acid-binding protein
MRHVPTSLYIDTEVFKRQGLRFDTKAFTALTDTFAKGGLRLLVPTIMERELLRHFSREAEKAANAVTNAHKSYPVSDLALVELPSREELKAKCIEEMNRQWSSFKEHFVVENLPIAGNLDDVVDWYFEIRPPFSEKKSKEFPDAFILSVLDQHHKQHHANIAVVGSDGDFRQACEGRRYVLYFPDLEKYIEAFQPELSGKERLPCDVDLTKPITTEDLTELKAILARGQQVTPIEIERIMQLLGSRGSNYDYFFQNAGDAVWLDPLFERGYFLNPPDAEQTTEGQFIVSRWPPLEYLIRIFDASPAEVMGIISELPNTDNFRVLEGILKIMLKADTADAILRLSRFITAFIDHSRWGHELIISLLRKPFIFDARLSEVTPALLLKIVEFRSDPREQEKRTLRKDNQEGWNTSLEPNPRFDQWQYQQILERAVRPLAEHEPYQVSRILIDAVASMIRLGMHPEDFEKGGDQDYSEIWCRRLDKPDRDYQDGKETLVQTMTYACEQVYDKVPESIDGLDQALRNHRWKIFKRLRQHLYASHPNDQTLPWIREQILGHDDYPRWDHHYEFQLMIRKASEHFGLRLLSEEERSGIFDAILGGPSKEDFREWMGEQYSEEAFQQRQRYFHRIQLRPFARLLSWDVRRYIDELEGEFSAEAITDECYSPYGGVTGGTVSYCSPKSAEDLENFTDAELQAYLNDWNEEHRDKDNWLIEINISALAGVFQSLFNEKIVPDGKRLDFWLANRDQIARPVYVAAMLKAMLELVKERNFDKLEQWIEFCAWALSHPDTLRVEGQPEPTDESRDHPDWGSSRRAVVDFIDVCVNKDTDAPITARYGLAALLRQACGQSDWRLDCDRPVLLNRDDPITEAINNTRSRALESLINFGFWIRRQLPEDQLPEVTDILAERLSDDAEITLTRPEQALLGMHFGSLCTINRDWAAQQREIFFPQAIEAVWRDAFGSYIRFNRPVKLTFELLRGEFEYAIDHLNILANENGDDMELIDRLGQHLFTYYLWDVYPLTGEESLLERFYDKTKDDRKRWGQLFDHVGRSLRNSGRHLDKALANRIIAFFDWRFESAEPLELQEFTFWLEAECLQPDWRLQSYLKILDFGLGKNVGLSLEVSALNKLLSNHLELVLECFVKITDAMDQGTQMFILADEARPILKAGLTAEDPQVRENAERAQENLLRLGRFDYLDVE